MGTHVECNEYKYPKNVLKIQKCTINYLTDTLIELLKRYFNIIIDFKDISFLVKISITIMSCMEGTL